MTVEELSRPGGVACPYRSRALRPIDGHLGPAREDFQVDEIPAYAPAGEGSHWLVRIRKDGLSTPAAIRLLADAAGVSPREVGSAGRKDTHAITTQWLSLPVEPVDPGDPRLRLLERAPHTNKLKMGHLRGNRFTIRLVGLHPEAAARLPALEASLRAGVPNYFGPQRFGRAGLAKALHFLSHPRVRVRDPKFLASVAQSAIFNAWLGARVSDDLLDTALLGDVLKRRETGGMFDCAEPAVDGPRVLAGELDPTGPMPGPKMWAATGPAGGREAAAFDALGLDERSRTTLARWAPGTRRPARLIAQDLSLDLDGARLIARFTLPKGAFATTVLAELAHPPGGDLRPPQTPDAT